MTNFKKYIVILILILAAILRFYALSTDPPHLTNDEAALGYNAYSILKTGRDEHGEFLPIIFKSFGDWKPGLYIYLTVPAIALFGLNEFSTRLVSALAGIIAIYLAYLLGNRLFLPKKLGLWIAFFLAISPWHIHFSRGAWEVNVALTLCLVGIYLFIKGLYDNPKWMGLSACFFGLTLWTYQGAKLSTFLILIALGIIYLKDILKISRKVLISSLLLGILIVVPIALSFTQGKTGRLDVYSVFSYPRPQEVVQDILKQSNEQIDSVDYNLFHSERLSFIRGILSRYLNHFSGRFLFIEGDWQSKLHGAPDSGELLLLDCILIIAGFIFIAKNIENRGIKFIVLWLLLSPLPAALSRDQVQAVRSFNMVVPLVFMVAFGAELFYKYLSKNKMYILIILTFAVVYIFNFVYFVDQYLVHLPKKDAPDWAYGYKQVVQEITPIQNNYKEIVIKQSYAQPYIFFLFYQKYDPGRYQQIFSKNYIENKYGDVGLIPQLENVTFRDINWQDDQKLKGKLFIIDPINMPYEKIADSKRFKIVKEVKYPNGNTAFWIFEIL